jgi:predicted nuclease with TOPRIM domain
MNSSDVVSTTGLLSEFYPAWYAAIAGLGIGVVVKFINKLLDNSREKLDEHLSLRKELREELDTVKEEITVLQAELNEWREKYYTQLEITTQLRIAMLSLTQELREYKDSGEFPSLKALEDVNLNRLLHDGE